MSSSEVFRDPAPSVWALDELETTDVFLSMPGFGANENHDIAEPVVHEHDSNSVDIDAAVAQRLEALRPHLEAEAFERGRAAGRDDVEQRSHEQLSRVLQALVEATQSVHAHEQRWLGNVEENLAAAAVTVARHLIQRELTAEPSVVTDLVARALAQFPMERSITVRLHPDDLSVVQNSMVIDQSFAAQAREVRWHADPHIVRGGCLVDGRERVLDGRIDMALERAYRTLGQVVA